MINFLILLVLIFIAWALTHIHDSINDALRDILDEMKEER